MPHLDRQCKLLYQYCYGDTDIVKNGTRIKNSKEEYKGLKIFYKPFNYKKYKNNFYQTITAIIETAEQQEIPRHLICGQDAIFKVKTEVECLRNDIKYAQKKLSICSSKVKISHKYTFKYYLYKILKNFVFGKMRKRYAEKQLKYRKLIGK